MDELNDLIKRAIKEYSPDEVNKHIEYFVSLGEKWSGTPEEEKQQEYIKKVCEEYSVSLEFFEANCFIGYPVREPPRTPEKEPMMKVLFPEERTIKGVSLAFTGSTPPSGIEGELVYVGSGSPDDFEKANARGKIALIDLGGFFRGEKIAFAEENGVIGQIHINYIPYPQTGNATMVYGGPTPDTLQRLPKTPIMNIQSEDGEYLKELLKKGPVYVWMRVEGWRGWKRLRIPIATVRGIKEPERYVMVYGHTDTWFDGATDNCAANAFMLEMARILVKLCKQLRRSVKFAFWPCHSTGMYSCSTWYVDNFWDDVKKNMIALFNCDMIGQKGATDYESKTYPEIRKHHSQIIKEILGQDVDVKIKGGGKSGDDSFRGAGIPTISDVVSLLKEEREKLPYGSNWWWHTVEDTIDKVDMKGPGATQFKVYIAEVLSLCNLEVYPFEFISTANMITNELRDLKSKGGGSLSLETIISRAGELKEKTEELDRMARDFASMKKPTGKEVECINELNNCSIKLSRTLNPIIYATTRYGQDPYSNYQPKLIPILHSIKELALMSPDSGAFKALKKKLVRSRNKVADALDEAIQTIDRTLLRLA